MHETTFDSAFPHDYEIEFPTVLSGSGTVPQIYYPGATSEGGPVSLMCKVLPRNGALWLACFCGDVGRAHGIFSTPDPRRFCAVAHGAGYFINPDQPGDWEEISAGPLNEVRLLQEAGLILFADYTKLAAYGRNGWVWSTPPLTWDDLRITEVFGNLIRGTGYDAPNYRDGEFIVELSTGRVLQGLYDWTDP